MKGFHRFIALFIALTIVCLVCHFRSRLTTSGRGYEAPEVDFYNGNDVFTRRPVRSGQEKTPNSRCTMSTCFDFSRCRDVATRGLSVHVYPRVGEARVSEIFSKIVEIIQESIYYEENPEKACLFLHTSWDPLDRDPLSRDFQKSSPAMSSAEVLFEGRNHLIFNLYTGSWPQYAEMDFSFGNNYGNIQQILDKGIFVKASQSHVNYRPDFDVSLPLFARNHVRRGPEFVSHESQHNFVANGGGHRETSNNKLLSQQLKPQKKKNLLVFKGKRYIYGIGSETRNSLHYLNNNQDVVILTTCRHGKKWKEWKDDKCDQDDQQYDKFDYQELMQNSTFCLIPRGRRLGSYRFLEALELGCIPVILSNNWILPFEELIDWPECALKMDERLVLQIPELLRQLSPQRIARMRHKCLLLYERFFSSVEKIVFTSLLIIENRIIPHLSIEDFNYQQMSSPMMDSLLISRLQLGLPFNHNFHRNHYNHNTTTHSLFSAIFHVQTAQHVQNIERVFERVSSHPLIAEVLVLWSVEEPIPPKLIHHKKSRVLREFSNKFSISCESETILQMSPQSLLTNEEISFALHVFHSFPSRLIAFDARDHYFDEKKKSIEYSSKWTNQYSSVTLDAAVYHRDLNQLFSDYLLKNRVLNQTLDSECLDLAFVFFVSHVTREGPLKVTQRKRSTDSVETLTSFDIKRQCFRLLRQWFQYLPLIKSHLRLDPLLYKDHVSIKRKKYRKMELLQ